MLGLENPNRGYRLVEDTYYSNEYDYDRLINSFNIRLIKIFIFDCKQHSQVYFTQPSEKHTPFFLLLYLLRLLYGPWTFKAELFPFHQLEHEIFHL